MSKGGTLFYTAVVFLTLVLHETSGNSGDVKLKPLPVKTDYAASDSNYDDGGMGPLYDFARSFVNTALPGDFPMAFINETARNLDKGNFGVNNIQELLKKFKGYIAAIAVGVLFIVIFPIVGTCFCCCRLCGNCGGKRQQDITDRMHMKRRIFATILFVLTTFTLVGNICTYVSNTRMSTALGKIGDTVEDNLDDMDSYLDLVEKQVKTIGVENLKATKDGILYFLDKTHMEQEISEFVLNALSGGALTTMQQHIDDTASAFNDVVTRKNSISAAAATLPIPDPVGGTKFDALDSQKTAFDNFKNIKIIDQIKQKVIAQISTNLGNFANEKLSVNNAFSQIEPQITNVVTQIQNFRSNAKSGLDLDDYKHKVRSYTDTMKDYDKYRYAAAAGLAGITTLIVTLQFLGLAFGSVGQGWATEPAKRGCVSTAGGNFLMASVGFIFIFASLLMLLTTLCFSLGAILEKFVCQPLSSDDLQLLKIADPYFPTQDSLNADLSGIIKNCRDDKSAYTAFNLEPKVKLNNMVQTLNAQKQTINAAFQNALGGISGISTVSFAGPLANLAGFQNSLAGIDFAFIKAQLQLTLNNAQRIPAAVTLRNELQGMLTAIQKLEAEQASAQTISNEFRTGLLTASSQISTQMTGLMTKFKKKLTDIIDKYADSTQVAIKDNMGRCSPVWNLYESILVVAVCQYTIDAFNGFWFSIGWCLFFFMPSAVFSVKLAKHYRSTTGEGSNLDRESSFGYDSPVHRRNKVGHLDDEPINGF